jgi:hypothetical protein
MELYNHTQSFISIGPHFDLHGVLSLKQNIESGPPVFKYIEHPKT